MNKLKKLLQELIDQMSTHELSTNDELLRAIEDWERLLVAARRTR